jgi:hypothetical protein
MTALLNRPVSPTQQRGSNASVPFRSGVNAPRQIPLAQRSTAPVNRVYFPPYAAKSRGLGYAAEAEIKSKAAQAADWRSNPQNHGISQPASRYQPTKLNQPGINQSLTPSGFGSSSRLGAGLAGSQYIQNEIDRGRMYSNDRILDATAERLGVTRKQFNDMSAAERNKRLSDWQIKDWHESPLNPMGKQWDWAPWNDRKSKNSLNPLPTVDTSGFNPDGSWPIEPRLSTPIVFNAKATAKVNRWDGTIRATFGWNAESGWLSGIPQGFYVRASQQYPNLKEFGVIYTNAQGATIYRGLIGPYEEGPGKTGIKIGDVFYDINPSVQSGTPNVSPELAKSSKPAPDLEPLPIPNREIFPQPAPQFEPEGRPEYPRFPQPDRAPAPQRSPSPSPAPQPSPAPAPMPNQPAPIPLPSIDPTAAPTADPRPRFDPAPAPAPNRSPSPAPNPSGKPFPGKQKNPGDYHFEYYDEGYKTPEIVKEKQKEQQQNKQNQYQPAPQPNPAPEPKPAPDFDACKDPCIADMHDTSKGQKPKTIEYKLFKKCGDNGPEFEAKTLNVPENQADALKILLDDAADRKGEKCTLEANTLTIPEWWAVRPGADRPQMVILYAEVLKTGKLTTSRWQLTIPHYNRPKGAKPSIPKYKKGNVKGTLTLTDNSKIVINASTASECRKVINKLKILIPVALRTKEGKAIKPTILEREDGPLKQVDVIPLRGDFYLKGQLSGKPDWSVNLTAK